MTKQALKYCARAVVRHLDGDMERFERYRDMAIQIYSQECYTIGDRISAETKQKLYEMVS
jgi:hypothetical protein